MSKPMRLDKYCRGWRGQKYVRKQTAHARRRMESAMLRSHDYEGEIPAIPGKGYAS